MNILGITSSFHDTSAALLIDGKLVSFIEEERLIREKHAFGKFPENAINFCLKNSNMDFSDIDYLVSEHQLEVIMQNDIEINPYKKVFEKNEVLKNNHIKYFHNKLKAIKTFCKEKGIKKHTFAPHHFTHLYTAFYGSGFDKSLILSIDGRGEKESLVLAIGENTEIKVIDRLFLPQSVGLLYASVTQYLGYKPFDGEGTVMGLAAYGDRRYISDFENIINYHNNRINVDYSSYFCEMFNPIFKGVRSPLEKLFGKKRHFRKDPRDGIDEHVAAGLQYSLENVVIEYLDYYLKKYGLKKLCLAGGVALNSKMNGRILEMIELDDFYVFPVSNDAGCAIGAAMWLADKEGDKIKPGIDNVYYGEEYDNNYILKLLKNRGLKFYDYDDPNEKAADMLAEHKIVAWYNGRTEAGPRALGSRSILANPSSLTDKDNMNNKVKFRESWRPFAPSIMYEYMGDYTNKIIHAPFMNITFKIKPEKINNIIGASHVDNTARFQTVTENVNPRFYDLIDSFRKKTGIPAVLNTSFNRKGEPIVNKPEEALDMYLSTNIDALVIGNYILEK